MSYGAEPCRLDHRGRSLPSVTLKTTRDTFLNCQLLECWAYGAAVAVSSDEGALPNVGPGDDVEVEFALPQTRDFYVDAEVVAKIEEEHYVRYEVRFDEESLIAERISPSARWLFNRRRGVRHPMESESVDASLRIGTGDPVSARVLDLSVTGIGLRTSADMQESVDASDFIEVEFSLPGVSATMTFCAQVRNHSVDGESLRIGMEFLPVRPERFEQQKQIIVDYVAQRFLAEA